MRLLLLPVTAAIVLSAGVGLAAPNAKPAPQVAQAQPKPDPKPDAKPDPKADPKGDPKKEAKETLPGADNPALQEARARHARGIELYNDGDYKLALIEFQRSYQLSGNWRVLYNVGEVHYQLNNYAEGLKALEKYLTEGGKDIPAKRRQDVEKDVEALRARTAYLTITTNVPGAEVTIDDVAVPPSSSTTKMLVDTGNRKVSATKAGYKPATALVTLAGRDHQTVKLELQEEAKPVVATPPPPTSRTPYIVAGWATTAALAGAAVITGVLGMNARDDLEDLRKKPDVTRGELDDQGSKRDTLGLATDVLAGAAIIVGGVSLYFTLKGSGSPKKEDTALVTRPEPPKPTLRAGLGAGSLVVGGTF